MIRVVPTDLRLPTEYPLRDAVAIYLKRFVILLGISVAALLMLGVVVSFSIEPLFVGLNLIGLAILGFLVERIHALIKRQQYDFTKNSKTPRAFASSIPRLAGVEGKRRERSITSKINAQEATYILDDERQIPQVASSVSVEEDTVILDGESSIRQIVLRITIKDSEGLPAAILRKKLLKQMYAELKISRPARLVKVESPESTQAAQGQE